MKLALIELFAMIGVILLPIFICILLELRSGKNLQ